MFRSQLSLSVLTLSLTIGSIFGAALPLLSTTELESLIFSDNNTDSKEVISDLQCECVLFFLCESENVVVRSTTDDDYDQNECTDDFVCCKTTSTTNPSSQKNSTVHLPVDSGERDYSEEVTTIEATTEDGIIGQLCECVLPNQCHPENVINLPFSDLQNQCQGVTVCCLINSTRPSISHTTGPSLSSSGNKVILNGSSGEDELSEIECECVAFYLCQTDDVIELPVTEDKCSIADVCCKKSNSNSTQLPVSQPTEPTSSFSNIKVIVYGVSDDNKENKLECDCIPFFFCLEENVIQLPTTYNNEDQCSNSEVCCKSSNSTLPTTLKPVETTTSKNTSKVITYGVSDDYYPKELKCECVYFYLCEAEDVIELTTTYNEKDRCSDSHVCCKTPDFISLPTPQVPEPEPSNNSTKKVIVYGVSDDDEHEELKCTCTLFYLCESPNEISLPTTYNKKDQCVDPEVCCKIPDFISPPTPQVPEPKPSYNSTKKVIVYGVSDDDEHEELKCMCSLFFLCDLSDVILLPTTYNKKDQCADPEVCCNIPLFSSSPNLQLPKPAPAPSNNQTKDIICGVTDDYEPEKLECECMLFYLCPAENVVELSENHHNSYRCSGDEVCCKRPPPLTSSILPPPKSSLPPQPLPPKNVRDRPVTMEFSFKITWWR